MTVAEYIALLRELPQDALVVEECAGPDENGEALRDASPPRTVEVVVDFYPIHNIGNHAWRGSADDVIADLEAWCDGANALPQNRAELERLRSKGEGCTALSESTRVELLPGHRPFRHGV